MGDTGDTGITSDAEAERLGLAAHADSENYRKFRGKCKEVSEAAAAADESLRVVRGWYYCPIWRGREEHWWCERDDGEGGIEIVDPTALQFPSRGTGTYEEFGGWFECAECGTRVHEEMCHAESRYVFCSGLCHGRFVGVI